MAAKKQAAKAVNAPAKEGQDGGSGIYLDPVLAEVRDVEAKRNDVEIVGREKPSIDPELLKVRDAELKRGDRTIS